MVPPGVSSSAWVPLDFPMPPIKQRHPERLCPVTDASTSFHEVRRVIDKAPEVTGQIMSKGPGELVARERLFPFCRVLSQPSTQKLAERHVLL